MQSFCAFLPHACTAHTALTIALAQTLLFTLIALCGIAFGLYTAMRYTRRARAAERLLADLPAIGQPYQLRGGFAYPLPGSGPNSEPISLAQQPATCRLVAPDCPTALCACGDTCSYLSLPGAAYSTR